MRGVSSRERAHRMTNHLFLRTLYIARSICRDSPSTNDLCERFKISETQLHLCLEEAKSLGIELANEEGGWECSNLEDIESTGLLARWIELEEAGSGA